MSNTRKIIYSILTEIKKGENRPHWGDYGIEKEEFANIIEMMEGEGLIKNSSVIRGGLGNKAHVIFIKDAKITMKGLDYLEENSIWKKTYKGLKEVREWLPL